MMDVEIVAGLCPGANISVLFAPFTQKGWLDVINRAIQTRPVSLSISWGSAEDDATTFSAGAVQAISKRIQMAASLGITVSIAAGDDGTNDGMQDQQIHVDFPGSTPEALSVGGTMLKGTAKSEVVWWVSPGIRNGKGAGSTGGGVSVKFPRPPWQQVKVPSLQPGGPDGRVVPDVAALAGSPGYAIFLLQKRASNGGTSASAPLYASLIARINALLPAAKQNRSLTQLLYKALPSGQTVGAAGSRDITAGNNVAKPFPGVGYQARTGFDAVSGWGVPDGKKLLAALAAV
jgi:kumamolisin